MSIPTETANTTPYFSQQPLLLQGKVPQLYQKERNFNNLANFNDLLQRNIVLDLGNIEYCTAFFNIICYTTQWLHTTTCCKHPKIRVAYMFVASTRGISENSQNYYIASVICTVHCSAILVGSKRAESPKFHKSRGPPIYSFF